jgi:hypothetical protein
MDQRMAAMRVGMRQAITTVCFLRYLHNSSSIRLGTTLYREAQSGSRLCIRIFRCSLVSRGTERLFLGDTRKRAVDFADKAIRRAHSSD